MVIILFQLKKTPKVEMPSPEMGRYFQILQPINQSNLFIDNKYGFPEALSIKIGEKQNGP